MEVDKRENASKYKKLSIKYANACSKHHFKNWY